MATRTILDTDIWSEILKAKDPIVAERARKYHAELGRYTLSVITVMEVVYGYSRVGRDDRIQQFLSLLARAEVLWLDPTVAELAGRIRADLERLGSKLTIEDTLIAATAIRHGLPVATGNTRHFVKIQDAGYPLVLENWREPSL
ncbi:type II toxin-antitoxin system VapC family toxin [Sorangium sp. So ce1128]